MMPIYKARSLTGDMLLSPFEIFIYLPEKKLREQEERLRRIWGELDIVSSIFALRFISKENLMGDDPYLEKVFGRCNIFARILMPRTGDQIGIEIGWMFASDSQEDFLKGDLLRFVYQLCEKGLEQVKQVKIDSEFFVRDTRERDERLYYLSELERRLNEVMANILSQDNVDLRLFLADKRRYGARLNSDYLADDFEDNKQKLGRKDIKTISLQELAALVGFDVPYITDDKVDNPAPFFYDSSVSISVRPVIPGSTLPGLRIGIGTQFVNVPTSSREGIFAYVCTLIQNIHGRNFGKKDINEFLKKLKKYSTHEDLEFEDSLSLFDTDEEKTKSKKTYKIRNWENGKILFDKMPRSLSREYLWFKKIYDALFRIRRNSGYDDEFEYIGKMKFNQWCLHVLYDEIRYPFRQGVSNIRKNIRTALTTQGYGTIVNQVGLLDRGGYFYINVNPKNIHFPKDKFWEEAQAYAMGMDSSPE